MANDVIRRRAIESSDSSLSDVRSDRTPRAGCHSVSSVSSVAVFNHSASHPGGSSRVSGARGFTLIEVLIALAVLVISMVALIQAGGTRADHVGYLRDRTLATWVASDRITALRLEEDWPGIGTRTGEYEMARRTWLWTAEISETPEPAIRRVEVAVRLEEDAEPLARVAGYLGDPGDRIR